MLAEVLQHAQHGSVEEFVTALSFARLDLASAMRYGLKYNFDAAKQYLGVLALHQRQDILGWLLDNDEIVSENVVRDLLVDACKQPSLNFLLWLQARLSQRFVIKGSYLQYQFDTCMEHGTVEIASYLLRGFPHLAQCATYDMSSIHPDAAEFWRNECWPLLLRSLQSKWDCEAFERVMAFEDTSHAMYALTHGFLSYGLELPADMKTECFKYLASDSYDYEPLLKCHYRNLEPRDLESCNEFTYWLHHCVHCINIALKHGHWSCAKLIIATLEEVLPHHFPYSSISYFCVDNPERMDEKDMSEMIAWSVQGLQIIYSTIRYRGRRKEQNWVGQYLIGALVAACNRDLPHARKALMEHEKLADVINMHLKSLDWLNGVIDYDERPHRTSAIKLLLEHGMLPKNFRDYITFMHMWGMDPTWVDWALSNILEVNKKDRTENLDRDVMAFCAREYPSAFSKEPYTSMTCAEKFEVFKWIRKNSADDFRSLRKSLNLIDYFDEVLSHPSVTAQNITDFIPSTEDNSLDVVRRLASHSFMFTHRSTADIEGIIDVLLACVPLETHVFPLDDDHPRVRSGNVPSWMRLVPKYSNLEETERTHFNKYCYLLRPCISTVCVIKAHVMRLEAQLKALESVHDDYDDDNEIDRASQTSKSKRQGRESSVRHHNSSRPVTPSESNLRQLIQRYRSLGFLFANYNTILDFGKADWFLDGLRSATAKDATLTVPALLTLISREYCSNGKLFQHWCTRIKGQPPTLKTYLDIIRTQPRYRPRGSSDDAVFNIKEFIYGLDRNLRIITAAITSVHRKPGCDSNSEDFSSSDDAFSCDDAFSYDGTMNSSDDDTMDSRGVDADSLYRPHKRLRFYHDDTTDYDYSSGDDAMVSSDDSSDGDAMVSSDDSSDDDAPDSSDDSSDDDVMVSSVDSSDDDVMVSSVDSSIDVAMVSCGDDATCVDSRIDDAMVSRGVDAMVSRGVDAVDPTIDSSDDDTTDSTIDDSSDHDTTDSSDDDATSCVDSRGDAIDSRGDDAIDSRAMVSRGVDAIDSTIDDSSGNDTADSSGDDATCVDSRGDAIDSHGDAIDSNGHDKGVTEDDSGPWKELESIIYHCIRSYSGLKKRDMKDTERSNALQVDAIDIAVVLMLEAIDRCW